jgi:hypothetical protein
MQNMLRFTCVLALLALLSTGCDKGDTAPAPNNATPATGSSSTGDGGAATTQVALEKDICGKCGCCAGCETCCKETEAKCEKCGFQAGSDLCCSGLKPADVTYCKDCGHIKGSDKCCKEGCETCDKCGLHQGSEICCKVK